MRKFERILTTAFLIAGSNLNVAFAQQTEQSIGSLVGVPKPAEIPRGGMTDFDRGRLVMARYASCLLDVERSVVARALAMPPGKAQDKALAKLSMEDCLYAGEVKFSTSALRGAFFVELYMRKARHVAGLPILDPVDIASLPTDSDEARSHLWLMYVADCVVRNNPTAASEFTLSGSASDAEKQKLQPLIPTLGPCVPAGQQIKLSSAIIKNALAEVLYRGVQSSTAASH